MKVLHEAVLARPLNDVDHVAALRTEVELLTVEVRVLTERLQDPGTSRAELRPGRGTASGRSAPSSRSWLRQQL